MDGELGVHRKIYTIPVINIDPRTGLALGNVEIRPAAAAAAIHWCITSEQRADGWISASESGVCPSSGDAIDLTTRDSITGARVHSICSVNIIISHSAIIVSCYMVAGHSTLVIEFACVVARISILMKSRCSMDALKGQSNGMNRRLLYRKEQFTTAHTSFLPAIR